MWKLSGFAHAVLDADYGVVAGDGVTKDGDHSYKLQRLPPPAVQVEADQLPPRCAVLGEGGGELAHARGSEPKHHGEGCDEQQEPDCAQRAEDALRDIPIPISNLLPQSDRLLE